MGCRAVLGAAEAAGIPAAGKAIHQYLRPGRARPGQRVNQAGVSLGADSGASAGRLAGGYARLAPALRGHRPARASLWIPVWNWAARRAGFAARAKPAHRAADCAILRDRRLWAFVLANALSMVGYSLWTNWTTLYLVDVHHLTLSKRPGMRGFRRSSRTVGGFAGGWLSLRLMDRGVAAIAGALPRVPGGRRALAGHGGHSRGAHARLGLGGHFAQHFRSGGLQRQHVHPAARCVRRRPRGFRRFDAGGFLWRGAGHHLAGLRPG